MITRGIRIAKEEDDFIYDDSRIPNMGSSKTSTAALRLLAKCPSCPKTFTQLRSLYGHFGSAHARHAGTKLDHDKILYGCPFCKPEEVEFASLEIVQTHIESCHASCELYSEDQVSSTPTAAMQPAVSVKTPPDSKSLQPLGKCPDCPKVLPLQALFGHFGRVHSGQLNGRVSYLCPFCNQEDVREVALYATFEDADLHVQSHHVGCVLLPLGRGLKNCQKEEETSFETQAIAASSELPTSNAPSIVLRSSQQKRNPPAKTDHIATATSSDKQTSQNLYNCPLCDRVFNKQGLATHFGMAHDGRLDWDIVSTVDENGSLKRKRGSHDTHDEEEGEEEHVDNGPVRKSCRILERVSCRSVKDDETADIVPLAAAECVPLTSSNLNYGPWTPEEHSAFLIGHEKYGNEWKRISEECVQTRTPKQVGSHALAYFTTLGQWVSRKGTGKAVDQNQQVEKDVREGPVRHMLFGKMKSNTRPGDGEGDKPATDKRRQERKNQSAKVTKKPTPARIMYGGLDSVEESSTSSDQCDDGNFDYCTVCEDGGILVCCSNCPPSYHSLCITKSEAPPLKVDDLPQNWVCERCKHDSMILSEDEIPDNSSSADIQSTYSNFVYSDGYEQCCELLAKIHLILSKLIDSDHGYIFADPVDLNIVPNYTKKISCPMDYGTILKKIETGEYRNSLKPLMKRPMEAILLQAIHDVDLVHKNCAEYNPKGSSVFRAGEAQANKWNAYFNKYLLNYLPQTVILSYRDGKLDTEALQHQNQKPQQNDVELQQQKPPRAKKPKRVENITASSGVVLTKDQLDALENVFFSPVADLTASLCITTEKNAPMQCSQWYDRLEDLRQYKVSHWTAVVTISQDDKLYKWNTRQRKRYHLTLFHKPQFRSHRNIAFTGQDDNDQDVAWLTTMPSMTGSFSLSPSCQENTLATRKKSSASPVCVHDATQSVASKMKIASAIHKMHQHELYLPRNAAPPYRHSSSLFWDECLEELRFFRGEHQHTLVPRSLWVEIQRAKFLLYNVGIDSGILGYQIFLLDDELHLCDLSDSPLAGAPSVMSSIQETQINVKNDLEENQNEFTFGVSDLKYGKSSRVSSVHVYLNAASDEVKSSQPSTPERKATEKDCRAPLCKCTACEKSFPSLRKLMVILVETHVMNSHPNCQLTKSKYDTSPRMPKVLSTKSTAASSSSLKKSLFKRHLADFVAWFQQHPLRSHDSISKELYSWCWRQCNATSALLRGTPKVSGVKMNASKGKMLASNGFFRAFSYHDEKFVCKDEYEGSHEWDAAFDAVQDFLVSYGSTQSPEYYHCSPAIRPWIADTHEDLLRFTRGQHCELSIHQIERLILIGFCRDRSDLPNLTWSDVIWLKRFRELKQYQLLFGDCHVSEDFPQLHQWVNEQKRVFREFRMGKNELMKVERLRMLIDAGCDFFTADYFPYICEKDLKAFEQRISSPLDSFRGKESAIESSHLIVDHLDDEDLSAMFDSIKASNGHSLVLADENLDVYQWFIALRSALLASYATDFNVQGPLLFRHFVLSYVKDRNVPETDKKFFNTKESLITWTKYCERFMMFKAVRGHCHIPQNYPDVALLQWLSRQQEELYLHCNTHPIGELPTPLKLLISLGLKGKKRDIQPVMSSRTLKRKFPSKSRLKK
ncbi:hypothetical protein HJC23_007892 [Cyclotella cryptica]|uniref:Uncharacterized protein n=1 Tax=Cyclotella cryptica TaxID=29204 RepID=A0ABD3R7B5_9STRA